MLKITKKYIDILLDEIDAAARKAQRGTMRVKSRERVGSSRVHQDGRQPSKGCGPESDRRTSEK